MRLLHLAFFVALASGVAAILIYITGVNTDLDVDVEIHLPAEDVEALRSLQETFGKCVNENGLGLQAASVRDYCQVSLKYPGDTESVWKDPKSDEVESLSYDFNLCEAVATWEQ